VELLNLVGTVGAMPDDIDFLLQTEQMRDEVISKIRDELAEGPVRSFVLIDGVVYHEDTKQNRDELIKLSHEKLGLLAADKCYNNMKSKYWFPLMRTEIDEWIRNCFCIVYFKFCPKVS